MRWSRTLEMVEAHAEGEVGRVVTGVLDLPGATVVAAGACAAAGLSTTLAPVPASMLRLRSSPIPVLAPGT